MKASIALNGASRTEAGKGAARALRRAGNIPAILYSAGTTNTSFSITEKELTLAYKKGAFTNKLVELTIDGKKLFALPRDVQMHPVTDRIEHADFLQVTKDSKVTVSVPVKVLNAERSIGLKRGGALNIVRHEIELECTPENIPSKIEVDILNVNIGTSLHISAIELPKGVAPAIKRDFTVVTITGRAAKDEDEAAPAAAAAAPAKAAAKPAAKK